MSAVKQPWRISDFRRSGTRWSLLFRPIAQVALFRGLALAVQVGVPLDVAIERANKVDWRSDAPCWVDTIIRSNGRMVAKDDAVRLTGRVIGYLVAGDVMSNAAVTSIRQDHAAMTQQFGGLPTPIV